MVNLIVSYCFYFSIVFLKILQNLSDSRIKQIRIFFLKLSKRAFIKAVTNLLHKHIIKPEVMSHAKAHGKHFLSFKKVTDICP